MTYVKYGVKLSANQKQKLAKAVSDKSAITLRLTKSDLTGNDMLMLTASQLKRIKKAITNKTGVDLKISKTQIRSVVQKGGSLWSSLLNLGMKALPCASKAVPALATGAIQALGSLGVDKIFGRGQSGGFLIPQDKINELIQYKDLLTNKQKEQIVNAIHTGGQMIVKPSKRQIGGFLGTLLGAIGIPLLMKALTGSGLQVDNKRSKRSANVHVPKNTTSKGGLIVPYQNPPPFIGTWDNPIGMGVKKKAPKRKTKKKKKNSKKRTRIASRTKQSFQLNSNTRSNILRFINKPLSNLDLLNWVKHLGIKHFRGIYSRDSLPMRILQYEVGIINLDTQLGTGTHWVAYRNGPNHSEYFDSFGLIMPNKVLFYLKTNGKPIYYSGDEIQERDSVLCGYWCLYYLLERQKGVPMLNVIHNAKFDMNNQAVNHRFIIDYFKNI